MWWWLNVSVSHPSVCHRSLYDFIWASSIVGLISERPEQNDLHSVKVVFKYISLKANIFILIKFPFQISILKESISAWITNSTNHYSFKYDSKGLLDNTFTFAANKSLLETMLDSNVIRRHWATMSSAFAPTRATLMRQPPPPPPPPPPPLKCFPLEEEEIPLTPPSSHSLLLWYYILAT